MMTFVDTSAVMAAADAGDSDHAAARSLWVRLIGEGARLVSTNYVVVESMCLLQRRLGMEAVRAFLSDVVPVLAIEWIGQGTHQAAASAVAAAGRRDLSIVDCTSFEVMRQAGIERAFTFDRHFADQGFGVVP